MAVSLKSITFATIMSDFTTELKKLHELSGAEFSRQVERIALRKEFHPLDTDPEILQWAVRKVMTIKGFW